MNDNIIETLKIQPMSNEEKQKRHILNRLYGPISSGVDKTRNNRFYNLELWEKAMNDPIFQEKIKNKSLFLELGHPENREETDMTCVCACIPEMPKLIDGVLYATVDVLDTPNGNLLNKLIDYGFVPGISSRGSGDVDENNEVDPETFFLETWDIVQVPSLEIARLNKLDESLKKNDLRKALKESLESATPDERKVMEDSLNHLGIKLNEGINTQKSDNINKVVEIGETNNEKVEVVDNESKSLVKSLTEALTSKATLEKKLQELQEKLAVSDAKVSSLEKEVDNYKKTSISLSKRISEVKGLKQENQSLKEQLENQKIELAGKNSNISILREKLNDSKKTNTTLNESTSEKDSKLVKLQEELSSAKNEIKELNEKLNKSINNVDVKKLEQELSKKDKLVESCRKNIKTVVNKYIESKAVALGVKSNEITNRLNENFTLEDVDKVCEDLQQYNLRIGQLPFNVNSSRIRVTESKGSRYEPKQVDIADDVDDLVRLADSFN